MDYLHQLFEIPPHGSCISSPPLIYLFSYQYQYGLRGIYFILWVIIQHYFVPQIVPLQPLGALSRDSCISLTFHHGGFSLFLSTSLLSGATWCYRFISYFSCLGSRISINYFLTLGSFPGFFKISDNGHTAWRAAWEDEGGQQSQPGKGVQEDVSKELTPNTTDVLGQEIARLEIRHSPACSRSTCGLVGLRAVGSDGVEEKGSGHSAGEPPSCDCYYSEHFIPRSAAVNKEF